MTSVRHLIVCAKIVQRLNCACRMCASLNLANTLVQSFSDSNKQSDVALGFSIWVRVCQDVF